MNILFITILDVVFPFWALVYTTLKRMTLNIFIPPQFKQYPTISDRINHTFTFCIYIKPCVCSAIGFEKGTHNLNCSSRVLPCGVYLHVMNFTMFYRPFMCVPKFRMSPWAHASSLRTTSHKWILPCFTDPLCVCLNLECPHGPTLTSLRTASHKNGLHSNYQITRIGSMHVSLRSWVGYIAKKQCHILTLKLCRVCSLNSNNHMLYFNDAKAPGVRIT